MNLLPIYGFSPLVPFKGYVFKGFEEKTPTAAVFSDIKLAGNLDGEAVLWAVQRLAARREKTKLVIVICDGLPCAETANTAELERHLYRYASKLRPASARDCTSARWGLARSG